MKGVAVFPLIIGILVLLTLVFSIWSLYIVLESFRLFGTVFVSILSFFFFLDLLEYFEIDKRINYALSAVLTILLGYSIYQSWFAIIFLGIVVGVAWLILRYYKRKVGRYLKKVVRL